MEKNAYMNAVNILEDMMHLQSQSDLNQYFRSFETLNKGSYSFHEVVYHQAGLPEANILCYIMNDQIAEDRRQVAFTAISTSAIPVYTPIMVRKQNDSYIGYPSEYLEVYRDHVFDLNSD